MAIENQTAVDLIHVTENGFVHVRTAHSIIEDDVVIAKSFHRHVITPGADYSQEDARVQAICEAAHTHEIIEAHKAAITAKGV